MTLHTMNCGGACILKLHVEDGVIRKITSHGDIPRENSFEKDECLQPIQRRACLKGFSELNRIYAPDRLKHPLKQTAERGDVRGFKRICWDDALDTIARWYVEMQKRKDELGYLPVWDLGGVTPYLGPYLKRFGVPSFGNAAAAMEASIGDRRTFFGNPPIDIFNSHYIIIWANDVPASIPMLPFFIIKAKEAGIPVTVVDTRYTDTAASMATGFGDVPPLICLRPGTDGALLAAMANVIFRKGLYDVAFLRKYCFGFFPGDSVTSRSPRKNPVTGEPFAGKTFTVPPECSFVEYLDQLEKEHGGYEGVLRWASMLTGTPAEVIEKFAVKYAEAKPAFIFSSCNGGAQRTENGMYFSWLMIALSAMTGYINKRGGGFGEIRFDDGYTVRLAPQPPLTSIQPKKAILFSMSRSDDVILYGRDGRTPEQLREDVLIMNGIDLGPEARLRLEMIVRGAARVNPFNQSQNVNKRTLAWKKLKCVVSYERFMTATAAWSDIVLPSITDFEQSFFVTRFVSDTFVVNGPIEHMYEAKPDWWINEQIGRRLGLDFGRQGLTDKEIMKQQWNTASIPDLYKEIQPSVKLPGFEEILDSANFQLPVPPEKTFIHAASIEPGEFYTETGMINFYSPFLAERKRAVLNVSKAQYVRASEGYEEILENGGKLGQKGVKYTLQFITPHVSQRAHTTFDNVPVLKEQFPHSVQIHPDDAAARDILDGEMVYVFNDVGCIKLPARLTRRIIPGVVAIGQGAWYRPSTSETFEAWLPIDGDGKPERHEVPVDVGGCVNTITKDVNSGILDPFSPDSAGMNAGGALCEITKIKPQ